jgi:hypothetical protein
LETQAAGTERKNTDARIPIQFFDKRIVDTSTVEKIGAHDLIGSKRTTCQPAGAANEPGIQTEVFFI